MCVGGIYMLSGMEPFRTWQLTVNSLSVSRMRFVGKFNNTAVLLFFLSGLVTPGNTGAAIGL